MFEGSGRALVAMMGGAILALSGCSTASPTPTLSPSAPASVAANSVQVRDFTFLPGTLTIPLGTTLHYVNGDRTAHTVSQGRDGVLDAGAAFDEMLPIEGDVPITFSTTGEIHVTCRVHQQMKQTILVIGSVGPGGAPSAPASSAPASPGPSLSAPAPSVGPLPSGYGY